MIGIDNFETINKRYKDFWNKENHDSPILWLTAFCDQAVPFKEPAGISLRDRWLDTEYVIRKARYVMQNTFYAGDSFPILWPNLGPDIFGAALGCDIDFGENTSWAVHSHQTLEDYDLSRFDPDNFWYKKILQMTRDMADDAHDDYIVGVTDLHPGMDALTSLIGPEELCMQLIAEPELVKQRAWLCFDRFCEFYTALSEIIAQKQAGSTNWMNIYHPQGWYVTSCDFMGMISGAMYKEFVDDELAAEAAFLKNTIFHLDGPNALRHLDAIIAQPNITGIQWVYGAGQPTAANWIDILKKIQDAGKLINIDAVPDDLTVLKQNLRPEGLSLNMKAKNETEAKAIEFFVRNWRN